MESINQPRQSRLLASQSIKAQINFQVKVETKFGQGVFVCGSLDELGGWNPAKSLRLQWYQDKNWRGITEIPKDISKSVEFKFIISQWNISESSNIKWEDGNNRVINLKDVQVNGTYSAQWGKQSITLCLRTHSSLQHISLYFVSGSIEELGCWREKKMLQQIEMGQKNQLINYLSSCPQAIDAPQLCSLQIYKFSIRRNIQGFNYFYSRWGETSQSETYPGRTLQVLGKESQQQGRIFDAYSLGQRIVVDQSSFDELVLQRMTNQIYLASCLKNTGQFTKIIQKNITAFLHLQSKEQSCSISSSHIKSMCKDHGLFFKNWTIQNITSAKFVEQAQQIITILQTLVLEGHRVCLHCSRRILRQGPIKILYLTLLGGHSFREAMEVAGRQNPLSQNNCKVAQDVLQLVSSKMNRCKITIISH